MATEHADFSSRESGRNVSELQKFANCYEIRIRACITLNTYVDSIAFIHLRHCRNFRYSGRSLGSPLAPPTPMSADLATSKANSPSRNHDLMKRSPLSGGRFFTSGPPRIGYTTCRNEWLMLWLPAAHVADYLTR